MGTSTGLRTMTLLSRSHSRTESERAVPSSTAAAAMLGLISVALIAAVGYARPAQQEEVLARPVQIGNASGPAPLEFQGALMLSGAPGGVASLQGCPDQPGPTVHPHGKTLREVLDNITSGNPFYVWGLHDGVINVKPSKGVPALLKAYFEVYDSGETTNAISAVAYLSSSAVVTSTAAALGLARSGDIGPGLHAGPQGPASSPRPLGIQLHDVSLVDVLNTVARTNKHGIWIYNETH